MKKKQKPLGLLLLLASIPLFSGCGAMIASIRGEKAIKDLYFTYVDHDDPFRAGQDAGIVIGKITMECGPHFTGSSFTIRDESGRIVPLTLQYRQQKQYGIVKWKKDQQKTVSYVYAGDYNTTSVDDYKEFVGTGTLGMGVLMGSMGSKTKNVMNMTMAMPEGWFMVKLPPGNYKISDAKGDFFENETRSGYNSSTTVVTEYKNQLNKTVNFTIGNERITYLGNYHVRSGGEVDFNYDDAEMEAALNKGLSRLNVNSPKWAISR